MPLTHTRNSRAQFRTGQRAGLAVSPGARWKVPALYLALYLSWALASLVLVLLAGRR